MYDLMKYVRFVTSLGDGIRASRTNFVWRHNMVKGQMDVFRVYFGFESDTGR